MVTPNRYRFDLYFEADESPGAVFINAIDQPVTSTSRCVIGRRARWPRRGG
ncbi:hypothetical protein OCO_44390 [Mycobacterium intracellulare MOTT-02]|nr:hypothetical protein OCO_44390 [Mycobacterium intracellulare MOTT-02]EUA28618.1 hypothetical protein I548_1802 [Mycobacterium intracellulare]